MFKRIKQRVEYTLKVQYGEALNITLQVRVKFNRDSRIREAFSTSGLIETEKYRNVVGEVTTPKTLSPK